MSCVGCSNTISATLDNLVGVVSHSLEFPNDAITIRYGAYETSLEEIINVIKKAA